MVFKNFNWNFILIKKNPNINCQTQDKLTLCEDLKVSSLGCYDASLLQTRSRGSDLGGVTSRSFDLDWKRRLVDLSVTKFDDNLSKPQVMISC